MPSFEIGFEKGIEKGIEEGIEKGIIGIYRFEKNPDKIASILGVKKEFVIKTIQRIKNETM